MASMDPDDNCNTETEEETIAMMKKRARRVSFAETTAVHFFDRDEESDKTPPISGSAEEELRRSEAEEFRALVQANRISVDDDDDVDAVPARKSFFRPFESPSSASSNFGSATSNDEENFFGPISADFIKHAQSNSAGDDENHDITLDSATFSMHFRSIARSDSGGDIKTPTGFRLAFGESSQTQTTTSNVGNSMVLTMVKSPIVRSSPAVERITGSCNSNDMSLVKENSDIYDYEQLSPTLISLLAEGQKDVKDVPLSSQLEGSTSVDCPTKENKADGVYQNNTTLHLIDHTPNLPTEPIFSSHAHKEEAKAPYAQSPADQRMQNLASVEKISPMNEKLNIVIDPIQMKDVSAGQESIRDAEKLTKRKAEFDQLGTLSDLNSENQVRSLLTGSISSLSAKRRNIFKDVTRSSDHHWNSTHLQKQPGSFHDKGSDRIIFSLPLAEKSISRLKSSPFASLYEDGVNHIRATISGNASKSYSKNNIMDGERLNHHFRHLDVPVACLEEQFSSVGSDTPMLDQHVAMRQSVRDANISKDDRKSIPATGSNSSKDRMVARASPFHITSLGKQELEHLSSTSNPAEVKKKIPASDSSLFKVTTNEGKYDKVIPSENGSPNNLKTLLETPNQSYATSLSKGTHSIANPGSVYGSSSVVEEELASSDTAEFQQGLVETPKQPLTVTLCEGGKSIENVKVADNSTSESENPGLLIDYGMSESVLASKLKQFVNVPSKIKIDDQKTVIKNPQLNVQTPVRSGVSEQCQFSNSVKSIRTASRTTTVGEELPMCSKSHQEEQRIQSSMNEPCSSAHDSEVLELQRTDDLALDSDQLRLQNAGSNLQNALDICDGYYSSKMRNLGGELGADMEEAVGILHKYQNSLNDSNQVGKFHSGYDGISTITQHTRGDKGPRNLTDVLKNFNLLTDKWFSSSVAKLDTHSVEKLQAIMANLQKFVASKIICSEIYSQQVSEEFDHTQIKRVADTKLLMYKTMYGKVKMQLMHLKKKRLMNQIELLQSAVQESKLLKSKCCCKVYGSGQQDIEAGGYNSQSCSTDQDRSKDMGDSISILKQTLDDSERKKENLINSLHASLKMPREPSGDKTVAFVMDHFKRKAPCWFLQHELQLWEVDNAENKNGQLDLVLNYDGIISQRFYLKHKPKTSISISSELLNTRISKTWPKMNAATAFEFVLSGKTTLKYTGPGIFARETQRTSSLLSNLYDVLEETKLAQIELSNLAKSSFQLISVGRLDLQLIFINYDDGRRVVLSFDLSCLSCGVYPSEIIPYELLDTSNEKQKPISQSMLDEIQTAIASLRGGYVRILRICRSVSKAIESCSRR